MSTLLTIISAQMVAAQARVDRARDLDLPAFGRIIAHVAPGDFQQLGAFDRKQFAIDLNVAEDLFSRILVSEEATRELFERIPESILANVLLQHELTHWYQQIGTSYGYWQLCCDHAAYQAVERFVRNYHARFPQTPIPFPIWDWLEGRWQTTLDALRRHVADGGNAESFDTKRGMPPLDNALACFVLPRLVEICEGITQTPELVASGPLYGMSWHVLAAGRLPAEILKEHASSYMGNQDRRMKYLAAVPSVPGYGLLGASELVEGQAHVLEALMLNQMQIQFGHDGLSPPGQVLYGAREGVPAIYTAAVVEFARRLRRRELDKDDINTFLAVVDFALATPLHPIFGYQLQFQPTWRDLHPGWRFLRLCDAVGELGTMGNYSISLDEGRYVDFVSRLGSQVGWPTPIELAERFMSHFPDGRAESWQDALFLTASAWRTQHPTLFVQYLFDDAPRASLLRERLAYPIVRSGKDTVRLGGWAGATKDERLRTTSDWLSLSDGYRVAEAIAFGSTALSDVVLDAHANVDQLLSKRWGVTSTDFRA